MTEGIKGTNGVNGHGSAQETTDLVVIHSSDLHLGGDHRELHLEALQSVLEAAATVDAGLVLLAGDVFDHNRIPLPMIDAVARMMADYRLPIVLLPGNHDCLTAQSVYRRGGLADPANVYVIGVTHDEVIAFEALDLEVWGRPHLDHIDMSPLRDGRPRGRMRWNIAAAHGHWVSGPHDHHRSWLIHQEEIDALDVDYVALGHWDRAVRVSEGELPVYYSGSPDLAKTVNLVRFTVDGAVQVERLPLSTDGH